jgi:hypothetical protein
LFCVYSFAERNPRGYTCPLADAGIAPTNATATPIFRDILIENVHATGVGAAGLYDGLPEQHVLNLTLRNVTIERYVER